MTITFHWNGNSISELLPISCCAVMFAGMCFCLPLAYFLERREAEKTAQSAADGVTEPLIVQPGEVCTYLKQRALLMMLSTQLSKPGRISQTLGRLLPCAGCPLVGIHWGLAPESVHCHPHFL